MSYAARAGRALIVALAALTLTLALAGTAAAGKQGRSGKPKLALKTTDQAALVAGGEARATVSYRGRKPKRMTLSLAVIQGGEKTVIAANEKVRARPEKKTKASFTINRAGEPLVRSCMKTKLRLSARFRFKRGKTHAVAERKMKRDPARCDGTNPVGVEIGTAERCDPISAPGEQCLFPYPNDFYTRPDDSTPTGMRLDLKTASMPTNAGGTPVDPTEINTSDGFSPGAPVVLRVPGMDTPEAFAQTDPVPITDMGGHFERTHRSSSSTPPPASGS